jgi:hypothetical protein
MKGYHFFLEYPKTSDRRKATRANLGNHTGNVMAAFTPRQWLSGGFLLEVVSAVYYQPNSAVCLTSAHDQYIQTQCLRISEKLAREIHPALFARLDEPDE